MRLTKADRQRKSVEAALAGAEKQAEDQHQHLRKAKKQLAIARDKIESQKKELERKEEVVAQAEQAKHDLGPKSQKFAQVTASECGLRH